MEIPRAPRWVHQKRESWPFMGSSGFPADSSSAVTAVTASAAVSSEPTRLQPRFIMKLRPQCMSQGYRAQRAEQ